MGLPLRGRIFSWLATLLLLFLPRSININDNINDNDNNHWHAQFVFVAAGVHGASSSFSSGWRRKGFSFPNRSKLERRQQQQQQHRDYNQRRLLQLPWLLHLYSFGVEKNINIDVHDDPSPNKQDGIDVDLSLKMATSSLMKLRGGSNKSEDSSDTTTTDEDKRRSSKANNSNDSDNDKRKQKRNGKSEHKNKHHSKKKRKQTTDDDDDDDDDDKENKKVDDNDEPLDDSSQVAEKDSVTGPNSVAKEEYPSKLFLIDPIRMNEMAQHEASINEEDSKKLTDHQDATQEIAANASTSGSDDENCDIDSKKTRKNKKGKKKRDPTTVKTSNEFTDGQEETKKPAEGKHGVGNGKRKKREQQQRGKQGASVVDAREGVRKGVKNTTSVAEADDVDGETSIGDNVDEQSKDDAAASTDPSNSFWWIDVWTQQLSDPEDVEEEDEPEDASNDVDSIPNRTAVDSNEIKTGETKTHHQKDEKSQILLLPVEEKIDSPSTLDGNNTVFTDSDSLAKADELGNFTKSSKNETTALAIDQNATAATSESFGRPISYVSSGAWVLIDNMITIGLASRFSSLRLSRKLRRIRKLSARITRCHGLLSGKPLPPRQSPSLQMEILGDNTANLTANAENSTALNKESIEDIQKRISAIDRAREGVIRAQAEDKAKKKKRSFWGLGPVVDVDIHLDSNETKLDDDATKDEPDRVEGPKVPQRTAEEIKEEFQRMERVRDIDRLIAEGQERLADLICEKDVLQRRPNPLFDYTTTETVIKNTKRARKEKLTSGKKNTTKMVDSTSSTEANTTSKVKIQATRNMNFPPDDLVAEYLDMMLSTRRLAKMNHTDLWKESENDEDGEEEEESIGDDLFTPSAHAHRLYQDSPSVNQKSNKSKNGKKSGGGGSWLLRQSIGSRPSLGEKIGEAAETAAYKAVTSALMSFLARTISSLHGINVLKHSDIRLAYEQSPDLPPVPKDGIIRGNHKNYAEETIKTVMHEKARRSKKRSSKRRLSEASFVQQEAVTETLLSHVQISAPLFKLFPLAWQRALLGNIISLSCALISDFLDGLHFQILGHQLSFAFRPITEVDIARHFQMTGGRFNQRRYKAAEFEAAVQATAEDLKEELKFLDSWHERALGSGVLRTQIANMIARIVLTLTDEVLSGAQMDLWSAQAGGPRMLASLEHRIEDDEE